MMKHIREPLTSFSTANSLVDSTYSTNGIRYYSFMSMHNRRNYQRLSHNAYQSSIRPIIYKDSAKNNGSHLLEQLTKSLEFPAKLDFSSMFSSKPCRIWHSNRSPDAHPRSLETRQEFKEIELSRFS
jgi:hypothetical protein